jgi:ParB-like chromosome segregation protein Spo0J
MERPDFLPGESKDAIVLLTGAHRLEAAKRLGWKEIECFVHYEGDEIEGELWEIAENLHRAELTALERSEQVARWIELTKEQQVVSRQLDAKPQGGRPQGGTRAASRELGISEPDARRAVQVASLAPDAKQVARDTGLDDNRTVLLEAAKKAQSAQVHYLQAEDQKRQKKQLSKKEQRARHVEIIDQRFSRMRKAWEAGCLQSRWKFWQHIAASSEFAPVKLACSAEHDAKPAS